MLDVPFMHVEVRYAPIACHHQKLLFTQFLLNFKVALVVVYGGPELDTADSMFLQVF